MRYTGNYQIRLGRLVRAADAANFGEPRDAARLRATRRSRHALMMAMALETAKAKLTCAEWQAVADHFEAQTLRDHGIRNPYL